MKTWKVPVSWEMCGFVTVDAPSLEDAIHIAEHDETIELPDGVYVDASWRVNVEDVEHARSAYNNNQKDEYNVVTAVEKMIDDWLDTAEPLLDIEAPEYKKMLRLVADVCEEEFPELYNSVFGSEDNDFIFRNPNSPGRFDLFYYNPDSTAGGQIVQGMFYEDDFERILGGEDTFDVIADYTQYLSDVNSDHFFNTLFDLISKKQSGLYLGNNALDVCRDVPNKNKSVDEVLSNAVRASEQQIQPDNTSLDNVKE